MKQNHHALFIIAFAFLLLSWNCEKSVSTPRPPVASVPVEPGEETDPREETPAESSTSVIGPKKHRLDSMHVCRPGHTANPKRDQQLISRTMRPARRGSDRSVRAGKPVGLQTFKTRDQRLYFHFDQSDSKVKYHLIGIGSQPGAADLVYWKKVQGEVTPAERLLQARGEKKKFYISVVGVDVNGNESEVAIHGPFTRETLLASARTDGQEGIRENMKAGSTTGRAVTSISAPQGLNVTTQSIFEMFVDFTQNDPSIPLHIFGVGSLPGLDDYVSWQAFFGDRTPSLTLKELGIGEGQPFFVSIYAEKTDALGNVMRSDVVSTQALAMNWLQPGQSGNTLTIKFADTGYDVSGNVIAGFSSSQKSTLQHFVNRMLPIIKDIFGPPSFRSQITIRRNLAFSAFNIFLPALREINMADNFNFQLITHELVHAYRGKLVVTSDEDWVYDPTLSGFEEGMAQAASYICMNEYVRRYGNDQFNGYEISAKGDMYASSVGWDYDFRNVEALSCTDFNSDRGGMRLGFERYEMGAAAFHKIYLEDPLFFKKFNQVYYNKLSQDHSLTPNRKLMVDIVEQIAPTIEGIPGDHWIDDQRVLDCEIKEGKHIWPLFSNFPYSIEHVLYDEIYFFEVFPDGDNWYYEDEDGNPRFHRMNGTQGRYLFFNEAGVPQHSEGNFALLPAANPPIPNAGFSAAPVANYANVDGSSDALVYTGITTLPGLREHNFPDLQLYKLQVRMNDPDGGEVTEEFYRLQGRELVDPKDKIYGAILNHQGGSVTLYHNGNTTTANVVNGTFVADVPYVNNGNSINGFKDIVQGRMKIIYFDRHCKKYEVYKNIAPVGQRGAVSSYGTQCLLLDVSKMRRIDRNDPSPIPPPAAPTGIALGR